MARPHRWVAGTLTAVLLLLGLLSAWLLATPSGARWLLAQAAPRFPDALSIAAVRGTVLRGLEFSKVDWRDEAAIVSIGTVATRVELAPLLRREIRINSLTVRDTEVTIPDRVPDEADSAPLHVDLPVTLRLDSVLIDALTIRTSGEPLEIDTISLAGELAGSSLIVRRFDLQSAIADIGISGTAELTDDYPLDADAAWEIRWPDRPALSGVLTLSGDASGYKLEHDLDAPYAVASRGTLAVSDAGIGIDLENRWQQVRISSNVDDATAVDLANGRLTVVGTTDNLRFDGSTSLASAELPVTELELTGQYTGDRVRLEALSVANDWGNLLADGSLMLSGGYDWSLSFALSDLDPALADARLRGNIAATGGSSGRFVDAAPELTLSIDDISGDLNGHPVDGNGKIVYANDRFDFDELTAGVGDNRIAVQGAYGPRLEVDAQARLANLAQLGLGFAGALNSDFRIESDRDVFAGSGFVEGAGLTWKDYAADRLVVRFDQSATGDGSAALSIDSAETGSLSASLTGRMVGEAWQGRIDTLTVRREFLGEWTLLKAAKLSLSPAEYVLGEACLGTSATGGRACFALDYQTAGSLDFDASASGLPAAALLTELPQGASVRGEIDAAASGRFADGELDADGRLQIDDLALLATFEGDDLSVDVETASMAATVVDNRLAGDFELRLDDSADHAAGKVEIENVLDSQSALNGQGSLAFSDLELAAFFVPEIANPRGSIYGAVEAGGSLSAPEFSGEIGLRDGSVDVRRAGISVTDIGLLLRQRRTGELALEGSARSGDGYLQIAGETSFDNETGVRSEIRLNGEDFQLLRLPDWQASASPAVSVVFDERETRVRGELGIPEARINAKTVPETTETPSADVVVHRGSRAAPEPRRILLLDVTTTLGEDVSFSGFGLSTELEGSVRISGDNRSPFQGQGRVVLQEGRYRAYGQNLEIESGELVFNGPLDNPALNVRATRTASDNTVAGIHLTGTPSQLRSEVYSEPPLGDAEALSYLLTGRPLSSADSEEGDMLNQAAFALGLTTAGSVASRVRNQLGLDTLGIQGGAGDRQLVAGKQVSDRLFIEYAYGVVDSLGTLLLRYQLSRRLMVESRSGSVRNVDVVYSVKKP